MWLLSVSEFVSLPGRPPLSLSGVVCGPFLSTKQINKQVLERMQRKGNPSVLLGMQTAVATVENGMEFPQKTENRTAF